MRERTISWWVEPVLAPVGEFKRKARDRSEIAIKRNVNRRKIVSVHEKRCDLNGLNRILFGKGMR